MKFLFLFAHPDDETVACSGTIHRLTQAGHEVVVVSVTDGSAGDVRPELQAELARFGSVGALRRAELATACQLLGVQHHEVLDFVDGRITNQTVWGQLTSACVEVIDKYQPDGVVTFDHTGWYFHLDHVGVSIATTLAVKQAAHPPALFFHSHIMVNSDRWQYVFQDEAPLTHVVDVSELKDFKLSVIRAHASQDISTIINFVEHGFKHFETYQLVQSTPQGLADLDQIGIFEAITPDHRADVLRKQVSKD